MGFSSFFFWLHTRNRTLGVMVNSPKTMRHLVQQSKVHDNVDFMYVLVRGASLIGGHLMFVRLAV